MAYTSPSVSSYGPPGVSDYQQKQLIGTKAVSGSEVIGPVNRLQSLSNYQQNNIPEWLKLGPTDAAADAEAGFLLNLSGFQ